MTVDEIMEALGGRHVVARLVGVSRGAPYNWRRDGIPSRHWPELVGRAAEMGVKGVSFDVLRATGTKRRVRREPRVTPSESTPARLSNTSERRNFETAA